MSIPMETLRELEALRQRVEELEYERDLLLSKAEDETAALMDYYNLTVGEAKIIRALAMARGAPLSRTTLIDVIGKDVDHIRTVDSHIKRLRNKNGKRLPVDTMYGIGYRLLSKTVKEVREVMERRKESSAVRVHKLARDVAVAI